MSNEEKRVNPADISEEAWEAGFDIDSAVQEFLAEEYGIHRKSEGVTSLPMLFAERVQMAINKSRSNV